ncbi:MAG: hypothetical protein B1H12_11490 [Desulfobacteraceae bacterium 4484_190.2]|nr:MAG: hypothetical protein B1H12_11490 [Desulfobacteraceae bacterium 4484_190.2]
MRGIFLIQPEFIENLQPRVLTDRISRIINTPHEEVWGLSGKQKIKKLSALSALCGESLPLQKLSQIRQKVSKEELG